MNSAIDNEIEKALDFIIDHHDLHMRWLNTLSYLEHIGSRKILKTQSSEYTDQNTLRHAAEEARHAYIFKKMTEKLKNGSSDYTKESMLCGYSANRYFQSLDAMVLKKLKNEKNYTRLCYLYVTTLVEERAGWLYPLYQKCLEKKKSAVDISGIIKEEERHLEEMHDGIKMMDKSILDEFRLEEEKFFKKYLNSLNLYLNREAVGV